MDFSAFYDISNLESFHDKLRLSRLDLSSAISSKDRLIDSSIDRRICRLIVSLELILISPNLRFRPPSPFFYDRFRSFLVTRNDVSFTTSKNDSNPCFQRGHVRLFYRRALLPLAFDSTVSSSRGKHLETRFRPTIIEAIDSRCRCKRKTISRKGSSWLEERTRARRAVESIAAASSMIRLETFALATLSYSPEGSRHFDSDYDNRATVIYQFIYCHA